MENKNKFKKLLATASALAVITGGASSAMGERVSTTGGAAVIGAGGVLTNLARTGGGNFAANDSMYFNGDLALEVSFDGTHIGAIDLHGKDAGPIAVNQNLTINSIIDSVAGVKKVVINLADGKTLDVGVGNAGVNANNVAVGAANAGVVNAVSEINLGNASVFTVSNDSSIDNIKLDHADAVANIAAGKTLTGNVEFKADAKVNVAAGGKITGGVTTSADNQGELVFAAVGELAQAIGSDGKALKTVTAGNGELKLSSKNAKHYAKEFKLANHVDSKITVAEGGELVGNVDATADNFGNLVFENGGKVTGETGKTQVLNTVTATKGIVTFSGNQHKAQTFKLGGDASGFVVKDGGELTGAVTTVSNEKNTLEFEKAGKVTGAIGAVGKELKLVQAGDGLLELSANEHYAKEFQLSHENSELLVADGGKLKGNVTTANNSESTLTFIKAGEVTGTIGADDKELKLVRAGDGLLELSLEGAKHYAKEFRLADDANSEITVAKNGELHGAVTTAGNNTGELNFANGGEVIGTIGAEGKVLIGVESAGEGTVTIGEGTHYANTFGVSSKTAHFVFKDKANVTGAIDNTTGNVLGANDTASVTFEGSSTVTGKIGESDNGFKTINVTGGSDSTVTFKGEIQAETLNIGVADQKGAATVLADANINAKVSFISMKDDEDKSGTLKLNSNVDYNIGAITTDGGSKGEVIIGSNIAGKTITFAGIGDVAGDKALSLLHIEAAQWDNTKISFTENVHITEIKAAGQGTIELNKDDGKYKIGSINLVKAGNDSISLNVNKDSTLLSVGEGVNYGSSDKKLKALNFTADKTLTIEDKVNIYSNAFQLTGTDGHGTLVFKGTSIFDAKSSKNIKALQVNDKGTVTLVSEMKLAEDAKIGENATLVVQDNITAGKNIIGAADNNGMLKFAGEKNIKVTGAVGITDAPAEAKLKSVEISGKGDLTFTGKFNQKDKELVFTEGTTRKVTFEGEVDANFVNKAGTSLPPIVLKANTKFESENLANDPNAQVSFDLGTNNGITATLSTKNAQGANFLTSVADKGVLVLNKDGVVAKTAGTEALKLGLISFTENGELKEAGAKEIKVEAGKVATLGKTATTDGVKLLGVDSGVIFSDGAMVKSKVTTDNNKNGFVEFKGSGSTSGEGMSLGTEGHVLSHVTFSDDANKEAFKLGSDIYSDKVNFRKGKVELHNNVALNSASEITMADSNIDMKDKALTFSNNTTLKISGKNSIGFTIVESDYVNDISRTLITINPANKTDIQDGASFIFTPYDADTYSGNGDVEITLFDIQGGAVQDDAVQGDLEKLAKLDGSKNIFSTWNSVRIGSKIVARSKDETATVLSTGEYAKNLDNSQKEFMKNLVEASQENVSLRPWVAVARNIIKDSTDKETAAKVLKESIDRNTPEATVKSLASTTNAVSSQIVTRLGNISSSVPVIGVAAGDDHSRYGAWFSPLFSKTSQKARKGASGYNDTTYGATIGLDTKANDDLVVGAAVTFANSEVKHKNNKSGNKTKTNSYMFSLYAMQQITDNWFAQAVATVGSNDVKNKDRKLISSTAYESVTSKFNSMSFSGQAMFGYQYAMEGFVVKPMAGLKYTRVNSAGYTEKGSKTGQNLTVSTKASNKLDVVLGAKVLGSAFDMGGVMVTPEVRGFVNYDLIGKAPKQDVRVGGVSQAALSKSVKPSRAEYEIGLGLNAEHGMMEYGVGYDAQFADKRVGHQGTLNVRVNF